MKFPIKFNIDHNFKYLITNLLFRILKDVFYPSNIYVFLFSFIISLFCFLIRKKYFRNINKNIVTFNTNKIYNYEQLISNNKEYFYIILIYILFYIIEFLYIIKQLNSNGNFYYFIFLGIIFISFLRNEKIYKHQIISYFVLIILFVFIFFYSFEFSGFKTKNLISTIIISFLDYYTLGLINGYIKYSMEVKFIDPYFISTVIMGCNLMFNLFIGGYYYFKFQIDILYDFKLKFNYKTFFYCFISSLILFAYKLFDVLVCYYYSPYHQCVCYFLSYIFTNQKYMLNRFKYNKQILIIIYIINIFFSCVIAEIIILNFCDLEKDSKYEIQKRATIPNINETLLEPNDEYSLVSPSIT